MPSLHAVRDAVARLPRARIKNAKLGPKLPLPYIAFDKRIKDINLQNHAAVASPINVGEDLLCQVCGLSIKNDPNAVLLISTNDKSSRASRETIDENIVDDERVLVTSGGPVHPWCAHVSLMFCPHISTSCDTDIVAWRCSQFSMDGFLNDRFRSAYDDPYRLHTVADEELLSLGDIKNMIEQQREKEKN